MNDPEVITIYRSARWWLWLTAFMLIGCGVLIFRVEGAGPLSILSTVVGAFAALLGGYMHTTVRRYEHQSRHWWRVIPIVAVLLGAGVVGHQTSEPPQTAEAHSCTQATWPEIYQCLQTHTWYAQTYWYNEFAYYHCIATLPQHGYWETSTTWYYPWADISLWYESRWVQTRTEAYCWWNYSNYGKPLPHGPYLS